jgi:hypothetical protein
MFEYTTSLIIKSWALLLTSYLNQQAMLLCTTNIRHCSNDENGILILFYKSFQVQGQNFPSTSLLINKHTIISSVAIALTWSSTDSQKTAIMYAFIFSLLTLILRLRSLHSHPWIPLLVAQHQKWGWGWMRRPRLSHVRWLVRWHWRMSSRVSERLGESKMWWISSAAARMCHGSLPKTA